MSKSLFISPNSDIKIELWIAQSDGKFLTWRSEEEAKASEFGQQNPDAIVYIEAHFREPTFRDTSEVADLALAMEMDGSFSMSINQVRLERFARLLKSWNLTDENDKPVAPTRQNVGQLHPQIAFVILAALEERLGLNAPEQPVSQE